MRDLLQHFSALFLCLQWEEGKKRAKEELNSLRLISSAYIQIQGITKNLRKFRKCIFRVKCYQIL